MKINWFKIVNHLDSVNFINRLRACLVCLDQDGIYDLHYKNIISFLTIGSYCKDCVKEYWECECNVYNLPINEKDMEIFIYNLVIYNLSKNLMYEFIKEIEIYSDKIYIEFYNYYENKLV